MPFGFPSEKAFSFAGIPNYVHSDRLGTPQYVTDGSNAVQWKPSATALDEHTGSDLRVAEPAGDLTGPPLRRNGLAALSKKPSITCGSPTWR
jgi:hypothetical protein